MLRLTGQKIFDATQILAAIINEKRPLPPKGKYRVTKMHKTLFVDFTTLNDARTAKIKTYDHQQPTIDGLPVPATPENLADANMVMKDAVPDSEMPGFVAWWNEIASVEMDVNIEAIPIDQLSLSDTEVGSIDYREFAVLGDLVGE